jgi:hypothetical protein
MRRGSGQIIAITLSLHVFASISSQTHKKTDYLQGHDNNYQQQIKAERQ